ncbi:MAG TPA: hypothetical protein VF588_23240 [Pyrinomonadaceae bacterium]|jgi:hypothetical protein
MLGRLTQTLTRLTLAATLLGASAGASLAAPGGGRAECPMSRSHACCKKARRGARPASAAPAARLCCVTNYPQPAPAGSNFALRQSPGTATDPRPAASVLPAAPAVTRARAYSPPFQPSHSPPAYIRHAAFLI